MKSAWLTAASGVFLCTAAAAQAPAGGAAEGARMFATVRTGEAIVSKVAGIEVFDGARTHLGTIRRIAYAGSLVKAYVIEVGGHLAAVSPSALAFSYDATARKWTAVASMTADQVTAAPEFSPPASD